MAGCAAERTARMLFLCRPNNPTGTVFPQNELLNALDVLPPHTIVVLDEAYRDFDATPFDSRSLVLDHPNLVVTRTFSKLYGLAGLRLGYGVMHPSLIAPMLRARDPFSINNVAAAAGVAALTDDDHVERTVRLVNEGKVYLHDLFLRLDLQRLKERTRLIPRWLGALFPAGNERRGTLVMAPGHLLPNYALRPGRRDH